MKIAILSDIHGNSIALDTVLEDISGSGGVDAFWVLGDLVALGPDPIGVMQRLRSMKDVHMIRGNTDRYVTTNDRPSPTLQEAKGNPDLLPPLVEVANTFAWTQGMVTASGWLSTLADLPLELNVTLPDGTRFLGVHASPGTDDGKGVSPEMDAKELEDLFSGCNAGLVCLGHTHLPSEQYWNGIHIVNPGAVSLSLTADRDSHYVLLEASKEGYTLGHRRVSYDRAAVIDQLQQLKHPGREFIIKLLS